MVMVRSGIKATQSLRERLFSCTLDQEPRFFKITRRELLQRCIYDVQLVQGIASNQLAEAVKRWPSQSPCLLMFIQKNWKLTLTIFVAAPLVVFPIKHLRPKDQKI